MVVALLRNRNLGWTDSAKLLFSLTRTGPLSASTVGLVGHGRKELSPELLAAFAAILAIPAGDLAALTGMELPDGLPPGPPDFAYVAELIWDVRRLTADQLRHVCDEAKAMASDAE